MNGTDFIDGANTLTDRIRVNRRDRLSIWSASIDTLRAGFTLSGDVSSGRISRVGSIVQVNGVVLSKDAVPDSSTLLALREDSSGFLAAILLAMSNTLHAELVLTSLVSDLDLAGIPF
jgi:hypothetical protein